VRIALLPCFKTFEPALDKRGAAQFSRDPECRTANLARHALVQFGDLHQTILSSTRAETHGFGLALRRLKQDRAGLRSKPTKIGTAILPIISS
jgi:hypothetical protein